MLMFSGIACEAQEVKIVAALPEDSFIVSINGKEYRAINADKTREIQKLRVDFDAAQKVKAEQVTQIRELTLERDLAHAQEALQKQRADSLEADFNRAREDAKRNFSLFMDEKALRVETGQFVPHGEVKGFWGRAIKFLDSPQFQFAWKTIPPTINMIRCSQ